MGNGISWPSRLKIFPSAGSLLLFISSAWKQWLSRAAELHNVKEEGWKIRTKCHPQSTPSSNWGNSLQVGTCVFTTGFSNTPQNDTFPLWEAQGPAKERQVILTFVPQLGMTEKECEIRKSWKRARECVFQKHIICNSANSDVFVSPILCFPVVCITLDWNIRRCFCEFLNPILPDDVHECASDGCFPAPFCCLN